VKPIKVIIVEDQLLILNSLKIILNMTEDIEIVGTAMNGKDALLAIEQRQPDVLLMDVHMPIMDGLEAAKIAKAKWPSVKIIMLTTLQTRDSVVGALDAGAEGYLLKAIDPMDLAAAIRLVSHGEMMISQEVAKLLFNNPIGDLTKKTDELDALTERELEILKCISDGLTNALIASKLFLSEGTVRNYISSIYNKLNVHSRIEAVKKAKSIL
jgi:DNA-binding NarL/FixJ family response regulator